MELKQSVGFPEETVLDFAAMMENWGVVNKLLKMLLRGKQVQKMLCSCMSWIY